MMIIQTIPKRNKKNNQIHIESTFERIQISTIKYQLIKLRKWDASFHAIKYNKESDCNYN